MAGSRASIRFPPCSKNTTHTPLEKHIYFLLFMYIGRYKTQGRKWEQEIYMVSGTHAGSDVMTQRNFQTNNA